MEESVALEAEAKKAEEQDGAKKEVVTKEKKQAVEMRNRALERVGQTRKRNTEENEGKKETKRLRSYLNIQKPVRRAYELIQG